VRVGVEEYLVLRGVEYLVACMPRSESFGDLFPSGVPAVSKAWAMEENVSQIVRCSTEGAGFHWSVRELRLASTVGNLVEDDVEKRRSIVRLVG
jgi:hypothetical protein